MLLTPEQTAPPAVLVRANELVNRSGHVIVPALIELGNDRELLEDHLASLPADQQRVRGQVDSHLAIARAKMEDAGNFEEAVSFLSGREVMAILNSPATLRTVFAMSRAGQVAGIDSQKHSGCETGR